MADPLAEPGATAVLSDATSLYIALGELVDIAKECERLGAEQRRLMAMIEAQRTKLANEQFTSRAPANVVQHEREKLVSFEQQVAAIAEKRGQLACTGVRLNLTAGGRPALPAGLRSHGAACRRPRGQGSPQIARHRPRIAGGLSRVEARRGVPLRRGHIEGGSPNMGLGTGDLEKLILLSPTKGIPVVSWKRNRITVRPREGWQPNRVYRVELLPGLQDLRRNKSDTTTILTFSTGGPIPSDTLSGLAIDWVQGPGGAPGAGGAGAPARQPGLSYAGR